MSRQINLFNPDLLVRDKPLSATRIAQLLSLVVLGCAAYGGYGAYANQQLRGEADQVSAQSAQARAELAKVNAAFQAPQKDAVLEQQVQSAESELKTLRQLTETLRRNDSRSAGGYAEYMQAFARQIESGIWLTGFELSADKFNLYGRTLDAKLIPAYISRLQREPKLQGKSFGMLEVQTPAARPGGAPLQTNPLAMAALNAGNGINANNANNLNNPGAATPSATLEKPAYLEFSLRSGTGSKTDDVAAGGKP